MDEYVKAIERFFHDKNLATLCMVVETLTPDQFLLVDISGSQVVDIAPLDAPECGLPGVPVEDSHRHVLVSTGEETYREDILSLLEMLQVEHDSVMEQSRFDVDLGTPRYLAARDRIADHLNKL
jgi:hypothetical protein